MRTLEGCHLFPLFRKLAIDEFYVHKEFLFSFVSSLSHLIKIVVYLFIIFGCAGSSLRGFLVAVGGGCSPVAVLGLLTLLASLDVEDGL